MIYITEAGLAPEKGELKNGGLSCDVIENTYRKNVDVRVSYDVHENKPLKLSILRCL
jgi:hypothetical protein